MVGGERGQTHAGNQKSGAGKRAQPESEHRGKADKLKEDEAIAIHLCRRLHVVNDLPIPEGYCRATV